MERRSDRDREQWRQGVESSQWDANDQGMRWSWGSSAVGGNDQYRTVNNPKNNRPSLGYRGLQTAATSRNSTRVLCAICIYLFIYLGTYLSVSLNHVVLVGQIWPVG